MRPKLDNGGWKKHTQPWCLKQADFFQIRPLKLFCCENYYFRTNHGHTVLSETKTAVTWQVLKSDL